MENTSRPEYDMINNICQPVNPCVPQETVITGVRLAAAYVPYQKFCTLWNPIEALKMGTAFPELYSPYSKKDKKCKTDKV